MCGKWYSCPRHYLQCSGKINYCVPCHTLLFNKLTVLKLPDVVVFAEGCTFFLQSSLYLLLRSSNHVTEYRRTDTVAFVCNNAVKNKQQGDVLKRMTLAPPGTRNSWDCCDVMILLPCEATRCQCGVAVELCSCTDGEWEQCQQCHIYYRCMQSLGGVAANHTHRSHSQSSDLSHSSFCLLQLRCCFCVHAFIFVFLLDNVILSHTRKWKFVFFTWFWGFIISLWFLHI